jgi:hypothetical protein
MEPNRARSLARALASNINMTEANHTLVLLGAQLAGEKRREMFATDRWTVDVPARPGVYAIWERASGRPIYVGETADLKARMRDLGRYPNHTCRRKLAKSFGIPKSDEVALSKRIAATHQLSFIEVGFGRMELEEYLSVLWAKTLINSPGRRHLRRFTWVVPES